MYVSVCFLLQECHCFLALSVDKAKTYVIKMSFKTLHIRVLFIVLLSVVGKMLTVQTKLENVSCL